MKAIDLAITRVLREGTSVIPAVIVELTGSGAAGGYDLPLGATPYWRRRRKQKKQQVAISTAT